MKAAASAALRAFADKKSEIVKYLLAFAAVMLIGAGLISFQGEDPVRALSAIWSGALGGRHRNREYHRLDHPLRHDGDGRGRRLQVGRQQPRH